jgi:thiamine biosynthesis lipoprotein
MTDSTQRFEHGAMACTFGLYLLDVEVRYARSAAQAAFDEIDRLETLLSRYIPHSDIARISALEPGQSVRVSPETIECLQLATKVYTATAGAFDVAFRSRRGVPSAPLVFDPAARAVGVQTTHVSLDLGAIGKGYAVDRAVTVLREWRIRSFLLHSGESTAYAQATWRVALRGPDPSTTLGSLELTNTALSGSGQRLHGGHIVDPRTEQSADRYDATWAIAPSAALSDALSTAFMLMSPDAVQDLCGQWPGVSAILLPAGAAVRDARCFGPRGAAVQWSEFSGDPPCRPPTPVPPPSSS